jgi:CcmD family protein
MKKLISLLVLFIMTLQASVAQTAEPEMADAMRQSGKIYVVVGVITIIFIGIIVYIIRVDSRVSRLEKTLKDQRDLK